MISSISYLNKYFLFIFTIALAAAGCAGGKISAPVNQVAKGSHHIAVYPIENLSGAPAPFKELRLSLITKMRQRGLDVLAEEDLERFMERNRIRYIGGIERSTAEAFRKEAGIDAVLIVSLERYDETFPPKISLIGRAVSTTADPSIVWTGRASLSGNDSPGLLGLGLVDDLHVLEERALLLLTNSLAEYASVSWTNAERVAEGSPAREGDYHSSLAGYRHSGGAPGGKSRFRPRVEYRSSVMRPDKKYRVAVLPFQNLSARKSAGDIMTLQFVLQLSKLPNVNVVEPGVIREEMLNKRIIMAGGVSLADVDLISDYPEVDLIVSGTVFAYQDYVGNGGKPKVDFSAQVIDRQSKQLVWASQSQNEGDDGVLFFDLGKINTANAISAEMVSSTVAQMISE